MGEDTKDHPDLLTPGTLGRTQQGHLHPFVHNVAGRALTRSRAGEPAGVGSGGGVPTVGACKQIGIRALVGAV